MLYFDSRFDRCVTFMCSKIYVDIIILYAEF
jgi:hypothetical protein